jgi:hypothetical protein
MKIMQTLLASFLASGLTLSAIAQSADVPAAPSGSPSENIPTVKSPGSKHRRGAASKRETSPGQVSAVTEAGDRGGNVPARRGGAAVELIPPVLVDFKGADAATRTEMEEDLVVMSHLFKRALERGLGEEVPPSKLGVPLLYTSGGRSVRAMYVEGFGALFMIKVNMPLLSAAPPVVRKPDASGGDSDWQTARHEIIEQQERLEAAGGGLAASETQFDPAQLDALKQTLLAALRNAANIRHLQATEGISVAVFGEPAAQTAGTVLTLHVKPEEIRTLANDQTSFEQFAKQVSFNTYPGNGYNVMSVNSWLKSMRNGAAVVR